MYAKKPQLAPENIEKPTQIPPPPPPKYLYHPNGECVKNREHNIYYEVEVLTRIEQLEKEIGKINMLYNDLSKRLKASVNMGAVHGDRSEQVICARQMTEASSLIEQLDSQCQNYYNKLSEWHTCTKCSCPTEAKDKIDKAYIEGLSAYAWWKDGVQYVGTCGTTLKEAIERYKNEQNTH